MIIQWNYGTIQQLDGWIGRFGIWNWSAFLTPPVPARPVIRSMVRVRLNY